MVCIAFSAGISCSQRAVPIATRAEMTFDEMKPKRQAITDTGMQRYEDRNRKGLGGPRRHQMCGTAFSVMDWLSDAECTKFSSFGPGALNQR